MRNIRTRSNGEFKIRYSVRAFHAKPFLDQKMHHSRTPHTRRENYIIVEMRPRGGRSCLGLDLCGAGVLLPTWIGASSSRQIWRLPGRWRPSERPQLFRPRSRTGPERPT